MPAPHNRRTRPYDPKDRHRLDRRPQPVQMVSARYFVAMPGDLGRILKIIGFLIVVALSVVRFASSTSHPPYIVAVVAILALNVVWASTRGSFTRFEFVRANEFAEPAHFKRTASLMHLAELSAAVSWLVWLSVSFGDYDWVLIGLIVALAAMAIIQRSKAIKISQPRNVWEK